ncbi:FG-GAP-like repeat-containing protein [Acidicapsa acidisoli]|uniref:FG-GAP-like repeat-containing protein n=1 Tax=Acidicapsa acidisoli TaxID=1615681 RepID=UPI0021E09E8C|nr:FG-GAP-like repeat-containing protein [Acidicapsa acidisoli]
MSAGPWSVALSILNAALRLFRLSVRFINCSCLALLLLLAGDAANAQAQIQTLSHHVRSEVLSGKAALVGPLAPDQQLNLSIVLPLRNQEQLTSLLGRLYNPSSPDYRKFLTVQEFAGQFGATDADYQAVVSFAQANGLTVTGSHANRLVVPVTGTVAQINQTFNVRMNLYQHPAENRTFYSPDREPSLALDIPVAHIAGLNNFSKPQSMLVPGQNVAPTADVTGSGPGGSYLGSDMRAAYYGDTKLTGTGQAVGIFEFDGYFLSDVNLTFSNAGQSNSVPINNVLLDGVTGNPTEGDDGEQVLDIVQAIGMAPGLSQVRVYIGNNDVDILSSMASENIAKQLSCSWGWRPDDPATDDVFFQEFAAQGQEFFAASGDNGAFDASISPFFYPGEDAYVTAVGGTHLTTTGAGGVWASETAWNSTEPGTPYVFGSGGGISPDNIPIPSWQSGLATGSNGGSTTLRNVPDVAMEGDFDNYMCSMGSCFGDGAGTSFAAPRWAGFMALINQQALEAGNAPAGGLGFINPAIYSIGTGSSYNSDLHDITAGNNDTQGQPTWFNAVTGYDLVTGWGSANGQALIDALAGPQVPGFWMSSSMANVSVNQGTSSTTTITVTDAGGFSGHVTLAVTSALPTGVTASWGTNPTSGSSVLTLTASGTAPAGTATLTITGTSGSLKQTTNVSVSVHAPTFTLTASPSTVSLNEGGSATPTITMTPEYGFTGSVKLSVSGLPSGVTASWGTNPTSGTSVLTLNATSSAIPGPATLTLTGTSGSLTVTSTISLTVYAPSFTLSSTGSINIGLGSSDSGYVFVNDQNGFTGTVKLSISGLPAGVTASFSPNPSTGNSMLTLSASSSASVGTSTLTITGTSGTLTSTTTVTLGVFTPTFTLSGGGSVAVGQGNSTSTYIYVNPQYGFSGSVTLAVSGLPAGVTALWNPNPTTGSSQLSFAASSTATPGQYQLTITGTSGSQSAKTTLTLGVYVPTFTLSGGGLNIGQGTSGTTYIYVNPEYGFTGSVNLAVSGLPSGVTASFSPNPTTSTGTLTLTASSTATLGQYTLTITGKSGTQTATTTVSLGVYVPSFTLLSEGSLNIGQGTSSTAWVDIFSQYGFNSGVTFSVSGLPSGVTASFSPNPTTGVQSTLTLTASSTAALGQYTLTITGTSGSHTASTPLTLGVYTPTFTLGGGGTVSVGQGSSGTSYFYISPEYGFSGSVSLAASGLPSGVSASFSPNPTTGTSSTLTVTASNSAPTGQYTVTITGTSGTQTASTILTLAISAQSFTIADYPGSVSMNEGATSTSNISISPQYGFTGNVTLSASGLPSGVTASFSPNPATTGSTLTLTASSSAMPGNATVTITGTSGSLTASTGIALTINSPGFTLSDAPSQVNILPGASGESTVLIAPLNGFSGNVSLSVTGLPTGVTASFSPNPASLNSTLTLTASSNASAGTATATVTGTSGALTATAPLIVTVRNASAATSTSLTLTSSGKAITTVAAGTPVTLTAAVNAGSTTLTQGQINFCDATATSCAGIHLLGSAQLTSSGTAALTFIPGMGSHSYKAVFAGTNANAISSSAESNLTVTTSVATTTTITKSGSPGTYTLTATVTGQGLLAPTGTVSFQDTSNGDASVGSTALGGSKSTVTWLNTQTLATGPYPLAMAAGDFNGDGILDLAMVVQNSDTLTILMGKGDGTFSAAQSNPPAGEYPYSVAVGDFNMDGKVDLAIANAASDNMTILLGNGDGTFTASPTSLQTGVAPGSIAVADFNHDGIPDIAVANSGSNTVTILLGNGDGSFTPSALSPQTGIDPRSMMSADFNSDGIPDLAVANEGSNTVTVLLGNGDGTFVPTASPATGPYPFGLAIGDLNGDGIPDLAVANETSNNVTVLLGNGDGTFTAASASPVAGDQPMSLAVGDFNGDGISDLAVANYFGNNVTVLLGNGDGTFTSGAIPATGAEPYALVVGDFNGDGIPDLATANYYGNSATILAAQLTHTVTAVATGISPLGSGTHNVEASYPGDSDYKSSLSTTVPLTADYVTPTIVMTPSPSNITTATAFTVAVTVNGGNGNPTPTGSVTLASATYNQQQTLSAGSTTFSLTAGTLPVGSDTLTATYTPDASGAITYTSATQSATITVSAQIGSVAPTVTVTPSSANITNTESDIVKISIAGASGQATPTGIVILSSGSYSAPQTLSGGSASFTIAPGTLNSGANTLTAAYSGDSTYAAANGTASITVSPVVVTLPTPSPVSPGNTATATATFMAGNNYSGTMNLTCTLTASPSGAQSLPTCTLNPTSITLQTAGTATTTFSVSTTAASSASLALPKRMNVWGLGSGGSALALVAVFGVSSRRRRWLSMLVLLSLTVVAAGVIGCGGGSGSGSSSQSLGTPATTAGNYTFTVTGVDSSNAKITTSVNVTIAVQ